MAPGDVEGDEATLRVAPVESAGIRLERIEVLLKALAEQQKEVLFAVQGDPLRRIAGLLQRQDAQEVQLSDHEQRIIELETGGKTSTQKTLDRTWEVVRMVGLMLFGLWIGKGAPH